MNDLRKADLGTIKTFLVRNVTAEKLMSDLLTATTSAASTANANSSISPRTNTPRCAAAASSAFDDDKFETRSTVANLSSSNPATDVAVEMVDSDKVAKRRQMKRERKKRKKLQKKAIKEHANTI